MSDNPRCTEDCRTPVECLRCHRTKAPRGRSVPLAAANGYCNHECPGYEEGIRAPHLWPSERIGDEQEPSD